MSYGYNFWISILLNKKNTWVFHPILRQLGVCVLMSGGQGRDKAGKHLEHQGGDAMLLIQWLMVNGYGY